MACRGSLTWRILTRLQRLADRKAYDRSRTCCWPGVLLECKSNAELIAQLIHRERISVEDDRVQSLARSGPIAAEGEGTGPTTESFQEQ